MVAKPLTERPATRIAVLSMIAALVVSPTSLSAKGFETLIGAPADRVAEVYPSALRLDPALDFGPMAATHVAEDAAEAGLVFRLFVQTDRATGLVRQLLFERRRGEIGPDDTKIVFDALVASDGKPSWSCARTATGTTHALWRRGDAVIHLVAFDDAARGIARFDPNSDSDPRARSSDRLRVRTRALPKRLIVRVHATTDQDLGKLPACPSG
jgi:hypothetical protein